MKVCDLSEKAVEELIDAAQEISDDFERYGEVLQVDDSDRYSTKSPIGRLVQALTNLGD